MFGRDWDILLGARVKSLPVSIRDIFDFVKIRTVSYGNYESVMDEAVFSKYSKNDAFSYKTDDGFVILFDDSLEKEEMKITLLHELGHILSGHCDTENDSFDGQCTTFNKLSEKPWDIVEEDAYNFALKILAPASVLWALKIKSSPDIAEICAIPKKYAKIRSERMKELYKREKEFLVKKGHTCFLQSSRERAVLDNFKEYIEKTKNARLDNK